MANKKIERVKINKKHFLEVLKMKKSSIRKLGAESEKIQRTEKTIRRALDEGEMQADLLDRIAEYLDVTPEYLSGKRISEIKNIEDPIWRKYCISQYTPDKNPYVLTAKTKIDYEKHFEETLILNDISVKLFKTLSPLERVHFRQDLVFAEYSVINKYFEKDSLGKSTRDELEQIEGYVGDNDPTSYFFQLEGIGISDEEILRSLSEENDEEPENKTDDWFN